MEANKAIRKAVTRTLKNKINQKIKSSYLKAELKGTQMTFNVKLYFYKYAAQNKDWGLYTVVLDKQKLLRKLKVMPIHKNLYNSLARAILEKVCFDQVEPVAHLVVDRSKNSKEIIEFNRYVADHIASLLPLNTKLVIEHQCSAESPGIKAADIFSWGIFKKYEAANMDWYNAFKDRIKKEELF